MRPVSVKELAELLNRAVAENKGDYIVLVSDDEECNGYHELWVKEFRQGEDVQFRDEKSGEWKLRNSIVLS
jgi:Rad3-related DNA helicase